MPYPSVTALPIAPSRLSRPSNFVSESDLFLSKLPAFRTQTNDLSFYVNTIIPNKNNYGNLATNQPFPTITQYLGDVVTTGTASIEYTSSIDTFYAALQTYSMKLNATGVWVDNVVAEYGVVSSDLDKPMVSGISYPQQKGQNRTDFNDSAELFTQSSINNMNSMYQSIWQIYINCYAPDDYGLVAGSITQSDDYGLITDI